MPGTTTAGDTAPMTAPSNALSSVLSPSSVPPSSAYANISHSAGPAHAV